MLYIFIRFFESVIKEIIRIALLFGIALKVWQEKHAFSTVLIGGVCSDTLKYVGVKGTWYNFAQDSKVHHLRHFLFGVFYLRT